MGQHNEQCGGRHAICEHIEQRTEFAALVESSCSHAVNRVQTLTKQVKYETGNWIGKRIIKSEERA